MGQFQEDAEWFDHQRELVANELDRQRNGTGMVCLPVPGEWVVCECGCDDFPGGNCKNCGKPA